MHTPAVLPPSPYVPHQPETAPAAAAAVAAAVAVVGPHIQALYPLPVVRNASCSAKDQECWPLKLHSVSWQHI